MKILKSVLVVTIVGLTTIFSSCVVAQEYPSRTIRIISPWASGGPSDAIVRPLANKLAVVLGQPVIVESSPGANGMIGHELVSRAKPDGYTVLMSHVGPMAISPALEKNIRYDPIKSFEHVTLFTTQQLLLAVRPSLPIKTIKEFIDYAKKNPGMPYGSVGIGSTTHLAVEWLASEAGLQVNHIPYTGAGPFMTDMLGERIDFGFLALASFAPYLAPPERVRPIALSTSIPSRLAPNTLPMASVIEDFNIASWYGFELPAGTPQAIVQRLSTEINSILREPDMVARLTSLGMDPGGGSPQEYSEKVRRELALWASMVKKAGLSKK